LKALFLYTEIASYTEACFKTLAAKMELHVVKYPLNKEAPFVFSPVPNCTYYDRLQYQDPVALGELCKTINPDWVVVSGWVDKGYREVAKSFKKRVPVILTMDNFWQGSLKQYAWSFISPFYLRRIFTHIWVPGKPQVEYAKKLGFKDRQIKTGFYSADVDLYGHFYELSKDEKQNHFPHRFIYTGRYVPFKNIQLMCEAFVDAVNEKKSDWELWCTGTGEWWNQRIQHPQINHIGFVQPCDMGKYIAQTGVFILPSLAENWGVVVHEFAAAGFPLICSSRVGATSAFLQIDKNGFAFNPHNKDELKKIFVHVMAMNPAALTAMGNCSRKLAAGITPETWAETMMSFKL